MVICRTKCNIIWRVLNIYDRAIIIIMIISKYIIYIFNSRKIFFCKLGFLEIYDNIRQAVKKMERHWNMGEGACVCVCTFATHFRYKQRFMFLAKLNLKTRIHTHTHALSPIYTHILTTTLKWDLNGFFSAFWRIFDFIYIFVLFSIFNFFPSF